MRPSKWRTLVIHLSLLTFTKPPPSCFALVHVKAFTYKVYIPYYLPDSTAAPIERTRRLRSLGHAFDFRETARELWVGTKYMWQKARGREPKLDRPAKRQTYYESVFGRPRVWDLPAPVEKGKEKYADKEKTIAERCRNK